MLLDVRMPGMDGIEVARRIVAGGSDVVVVLISIDDLVDLPSAVELGRAVPLVRKQDSAQACCGGCGQSTVREDLRRP